MPDWLSKVIESLKLSPRYIAMVAIFCAGVLFTPPARLKPLGIAKLQEDYRAWFGVALLFCGSVLVVHAALFFRRIIYKQLSLRNLRRRLHVLTEEEKIVLRRYISGKTRTQSFDIRDGVIIQLEAELVIARASNLVHVFDGCPYNIQPWAWNYLHKNPDLLR